MRKTNILHMRKTYYIKCHCPVPPSPSQSLKPGIVQNPPTSQVRSGPGEIWTRTGEFLVSA